MADVESRSSYNVWSSRAEEKDQERQKREGWLKMVHQEIVETWGETIASDGKASTKGVIGEMINKFKTSLPLSIRNLYKDYTRQLKGAPSSITTINDDRSFQSGLTSVSSTGTDSSNPTDDTAPINSSNPTDENAPIDSSNQIDDTAPVDISNLTDDTAPIDRSTNTSSDGGETLSDNVCAMDTDAYDGTDIESSSIFGGGVQRAEPTNQRQTSPKPWLTQRSGAPCSMIRANAIVLQ